jgi:amino acid adenylation domain-containing protein/non-ribosomal peptide synthase protein (TIGR01720 family)
MISYAKALTDSRYREHTSFWKEQLSRVEGKFHFRQNWHCYSPAEGEEIELIFEPAAEAQRLVAELSAQSALAAFVISLGAVYHALHLYTGASVVCVDTPLLSAARPSDYDRKVPLVGEVRRELTVKEHLDAIRRAVADSYTYQDFPVSAVQELLLQRGAQAMTNVFVCCPEIHDRLEARDSYDLVMEVRTSPALCFALRGRSSVFSKACLENFARHVGNILSEYANLQKPLGEISAIDEAERTRLLGAYTQSRGGVAIDETIDETIAEVFYRRASQAPEQLAISAEEVRLTYRELNEASNRLARFLRQDFGINRNDVVGLFFDRSELSIIGLLAILKAGAVYLPLDADYPLDRLRFMAADAGAKALLLHSDHLSQLMYLCDVPMFALDIQLPTLETSPDDLKPTLRAEEPAYIIYTSGSTGTPKGVMVEHRGLLNTVLHHIAAFDVGPSDRLSQFYAASFDSSLFEIFVALLSGATLVVVSKETISDPNRFASYIESQGVTMLTVPPVYLATLDRERLARVKKIVSAGDNARLDDARELARTKSYYNSYGPTETSICVTHYRVDPAVDYGSRIPIGRPISNTSIYVLDDRLLLAPFGCIGEICVGGASLARGYLARGDKTAEAFIPNPFDEGGRLYRTGDLGVWLPDGNLELVGRKDSQVKIRGYRIELGELESALAQHTGVAAAAALAREDRPGDKRLVAYVTLHGAATVAELREHLRSRLPEFMLPSAFVVLDKMPVTANGKIDRKQLPAPQSAQESAERDVPQNEIQQRLAEVWKEVLGVKQVGINDNFFELGGDSILSIQVVSRAAKAGLKLTPQQLFERQTIALLAEAAERLEAGRAEQGPVTGRVGLLPMQRWFFSQEIAERSHYNQSVMLEVPVDLNPLILEECLASLIAHHDALRSRFVFKDGEWEQEIAAISQPPAFSVIDLTSFASEERQKEFEKAAGRLQAGLNLESGPVVRAGLFRISPAEARLLFVIHHLVVDGVSWRVLLEDFRAAYEQRLGGEPINLPTKTTSVREWADRLKDYAGSLSREYEHWTDEARESMEKIPVDYARGDNTFGSASELTFSLSEQETHSLLQEAPRAYNTQINDVLLAAVALALKEWTGRDRLLIDLESHGREELFAEIDLSRTVGWLTAVYPALLGVEGGDLGESLKSVKEHLRQIPRHGISYGVLRYLSGGGKEAALAALPQAEIVFNYLGQTDRVLSIGGDWRAIPGDNGGERTPRGKRSHLLEITGIVMGGHLRLSWNYSRNIHRAATIERLAARAMEILRSLITHCCQAETRSYTPSDFPAARMDQKTLDDLMSRLNQQ